MLRAYSMLDGDIIIHNFTMYLCRVHTEKTRNPCDDFTFSHSIIRFLYSIVYFCGHLTDSLIHTLSVWMRIFGWGIISEIRTMNSISFYIQSFALSYNLDHHEISNYYEIFLIITIDHPIKNWNTAERIHW